MSFLRFLQHELTRPRGSTEHRFYRSNRRSRSGVALLIVMTSILLMTVLATEVTFGAIVRYKLASHQRDEAKAEALATTGIYIYRLVLVASKQLGSNPMIAGALANFGINAGDALWQAVPFINTGMMRWIFVSDGDMDEDDQERLEAEGMSEEEVAESRESKSTSKRNFLDFDGDFFAEAVDEERLINVSTFTASNYTELLEDAAALRLYGLMSGEQHDQFFYDHNIDRWELIGNLVDWVDADNTRVYQGGLEDSLYDSLDDPYLPKHAGFDSTDEIRLVDGWHDDDLWERYGENLTIYGAGAININTANDEVLGALLKATIDPLPSDAYIVDLLMLIREYKLLANFTNTQSFISFLESQNVNVKPEIKNAITTQSTVFRVTSTGEVNKSTVTIEAVFDFKKKSTGEILYWRIL